MDRRNGLGKDTTRCRQKKSPPGRTAAMTQDQAMILTLLTVTIGMFLWGRWRHDMIAMGALLACVVAGLTPGVEAFSGFGHPAVITVACVLILSRGLQETGAVAVLAQRLLPTAAGPMATIAALTALAAFLSGFMNNVGALALLMPVAIQVAAKNNLPPGKALMPLAFGSILGGMTTLIGTPPNLIVSGFRAEMGAGPFTMFDFTPVGLAVALVGVGFLVTIGIRLVPVRQGAGAAPFDTGKYLTEARIPEGAKAVGKTVREAERILDEADAQIVGMARNKFRVAAPNPRRLLRANDILVIEAEPESLESALSSLGLKLEEDVPPPARDKDADLQEKNDNNGAEDGEEGEGQDEAKDEDSDTARDAVRNTTAAKSRNGAGSDGDGKTKGEAEGKTARDKSDSQKSSDAEEYVLQELVVMPGGALIGRSASAIQIRTRYGLNLLAISRQGRRTIRRLRSTVMQAGDVVLMQGPPEAIAGFAAEYQCLPLATRTIRLPNRRQATIATAVMILAVAIAALGLLPAPVAFAAGALVFMALRILPLQRVYDSIDWSVIVLLGALFPVAAAMASTGAADLIARFMLDTLGQGRPVLALTLMLITSMTLSDFMNNAATAAVMCPIALSAAEQLGVRSDPFLMAVAIGASCAFLTPIGHQNNTLILGPGGFRFGDYWHVGLPMEILVVAVSVPMLLLVWPL